MRQGIKGLAVITGAAVVAILAAITFSGQRRATQIYPGKAVTRVGMLSEYTPTLKSTAGDTEVYFLDSGKPGATVLVVGGTHADEASGHVSAVLLVERAAPLTGRLIVIPTANRSAFTYNLPMEGHPSWYTIKTPRGPRKFKYGSRLTNAVDQWPDPAVFVNPATRQQLAGTEARNLNRAYPGKADGTLTQRVAYGITTLLRREHVDMAVDLHESSPEYPTINTIVAHDRAMETALTACMTMQVDSGLTMTVDQSPANLRGISHREWGDNTQALAFLVETPNPSQGRLRGKTDSALIVTGRDPMYLRVAGTGRLYVEYTNKGYPISERVGRHLQAVKSIVQEYALANPGRDVQIDMPGYSEIRTRGVGYYLHPAQH